MNQRRQIRRYLAGKLVVLKVEDFEFFTVNNFMWKWVTNPVVGNGELFQLRQLPNCRRQRPIKHLGIKYKPGDFKDISVVVGESSLAENAGGAARISGGEPLTGDAQVFEKCGKSFGV